MLDGIERGHIRENRIYLTPELVAAFHFWWRAMVPDSPRTERIIYPFRHLVREGFWELVKDGEPVPDAALGHPTSIGQLAAQVDYGRFVPDLWALLSQDASARATLRSTLLAAYFPERAGDSNQTSLMLNDADPLALEAERLIEEAVRMPFPVKPLPRSDQETDVAYVRHYLFPRVVTRLYGHACAVCRLNARDDVGNGLVDAAHVMPFARFHNDDPRNGLALCKNHHWGFDRGWFTVAEDYEVLRSSRLNQTSASYLPEGTVLQLPSDHRYNPAPEALAWHREHVFRS